MQKRLTIAAVVVMSAVLLLAAGAAKADVFGAGANQFSIDFVPISGATNPASGIPAGSGFTFTGVANDYRMGTYEVTNEQWNKFTASLGVPVTGNPLTAYNGNSYWTGANVPANEVSWYEAAQFVNWLNTSTGHTPAYKFTGTQGTADYTFATWDASQAAGGTNLYRNKDAFYYLPTEDEWVKAAYWNGTALQTYPTKADESLTLGYYGDGAGWNYTLPGSPSNPAAPWPVGSGSQELNGTYDMMGNVEEWVENAWTSGDYGTGSFRSLRGGCTIGGAATLASTYRDGYYIFPYDEMPSIGFRVASNIPEPGCMALLALGGVGLLKRRGR